MIVASAKEIMLNVLILRDNFLPNLTSKISLNFNPTLNKILILSFKNSAVSLTTYHVNMFFVVSVLLLAFQFRIYN